MNSFLDYINLDCTEIDYGREFTNASSKLLSHYFSLNGSDFKKAENIRISNFLREFEEDNNPNEILNDTHWKLGAVIGYEWHPWNKKVSALKNLSVIPWFGLNYFPTHNVPIRIFENSGNVYGLNSTTVIDILFGLNISYTFLNK